MGPQTKQSSFTFHRNIFKGSDSKTEKNCRTKLQQKFNESEENYKDKSNRSILSGISMDDTRRMLRTSAEKISKTFSELRTTIGTFSQRFRISTKRREILEEGPITPGCASPRRILGRTPTKLYSPFSIESPYAKPLTNKPL